VSWSHLARWAGGLAVASGVLVLLFVAYELWGTSITTQLHQDALRRQFDHELAARTTHPTRPASPGASTSVTAQPPDGQPIGTLDIPEIGVDDVVVQGTTSSDLELGPGHYPGTPLPGQPGNAAIAGHRTTYLHPFFNLGQLVPGDPIVVTTTAGRFVYEVTSLHTVQPTDLAVLAPTAVPTLTLTTCTPPYSAAQRLVVQATLVSPATPTASQGTVPRARRPPPTTAGLRPSSVDRSIWPVLGWGGAVAGCTAVWWRLGRRRRWFIKAPIAVVATVATAVLLFEFFQSIAAWLPTSF